MTATANRNHVSKRGRYPRRPQKPVRPQICRGAAEKTGKGRAEGAGRVETCLMLGSDDLAADGQCLKPFAQPT